MLTRARNVRNEFPDKEWIDKEKARFRDDPKLIDSIAKKYRETLRKHEGNSDVFLAVLNYMCEPNEAYRKKKPDPINF